MGLNIVQKILAEKIRQGELKPGSEIGIKIDQTLVHDATGTMAFLQFEAMGVPHVKTLKSVVYIDHNTIQPGFESADDHLFLQTAAAKFGAYYSRAGNGICHQVHLERFSVPGQTLLGADSHTPTCGGMGMLAIGAGGLDVAIAMAGGPFFLPIPKVYQIKLHHTLPDMVSAKDIILEVLRLLKVRGGVGKILEYSGNGVETITVPERSTITNMGAETGATTSIFPSDAMTKDFLVKQNRDRDWVELKADEDANYDEVLEIDLKALKPMIACPHSPDNVVNVEELKGKKINQVVIGSCTNSSYRDMMLVSKILAGNKVHRDVSLVIAPGSRQVLREVTANGALSNMIDSGARILECACGPCVGMGQAPCSQGVSLRTINRNFKGRSGTIDADVYLCSPETAAVSAITGEITDPRKNSLEASKIVLNEKFTIDDSMIISPDDKNHEMKIIRGPNIKALPTGKDTIENLLSGPVLIKLGDNVNTDDIMPAGAKILPLRSNIPAISEYVFTRIDPDFANRAKENHGGFIIAGENYGQGSSREHAALAPMYLGIKAVIAMSFSRIHKFNLINFGIWPLVIKDKKDIAKFEMGNIIGIKDTAEQLSKGCDIFVFNRELKVMIETVLDISNRQIEILMSGGLLNYTKKKKAN